MFATDTLCSLQNELQLSDIFYSDNCLVLLNVQLATIQSKY